MAKDKLDLIVSPERRHNMQAVHSGDTKPEITIWKLLNRLGDKFGGNDRSGKPGIILTCHRLAV